MVQLAVGLFERLGEISLLVWASSAPKASGAQCAKYRSRARAVFQYFKVSFQTVAQKRTRVERVVRLDRRHSKDRASLTGMEVSALYALSHTQRR